MLLHDCLHRGRGYDWTLFTDLDEVVVPGGGEPLPDLLLHLAAQHPRVAAFGTAQQY